MDLDQLIAVVAQQRDLILPFVGSGLTVAAGGPTPARLARELARRTDAPCDAERLSLTAVTRDAEDAHGSEVVRHHVAEIFSGLRLRPTPALTAVCGTSGRRILTTNYDDAIERAARERGLEPITLLANDAQIVNDKPPEGQLYVIHLHGFLGVPTSIVLPGATTHGLADDQVFTRFVSSVMAPRILLYLGFRLGPSEQHLHSIVRWLGARPEGAEPHYLLLDRAEIARRQEQLEDISTYRNVTVVGYEADPDHTAVERAAVALAPRADHELTWVQPPLLRLRDGEDEERLRSRITSFDYEWGDTNDIQAPDDVLNERSSLVVGGPGLGKTTLLEHLPRFDPDRPHALAYLRDFRPSNPPKRAIARQLRGIPVEKLDAGGALLALDGLDEVDEEFEDEAVKAILEALDHWPDHTWIVASRPGRAADALAAAGLPVFRLFASRRWARAYLRTRAVPADRVSRALLDGYGLGDLLAIPAFAKRLADRLLGDDHRDVTPLDLLVTEQYEAARREADRHRQAATSLIGWLRSVAIALELRGRASAGIEELAELVGPGQLSAREARRRLVEVSLLADVPASTAFPAKTLQQGLVADAILRSGDIVAIVRKVAVAHVAGADRLRDDLELTLDLVFEHADRDTRRGLQLLDRQRWARTVATHGDGDDAREAFDCLWSWHVERDLAFFVDGEDGLRSTRQAIAEITRRWPHVLAEQRGRLEGDLRDERPANRLRALTVLGGLPRDDRTAEWLVPLLTDEAPRVAQLAADLAGQLRIGEAEDGLKGLLKARDQHVRVTALRALVEIVDVDRLPGLTAGVKVPDDLRRVAQRLDERLDVDTAIKLVRACRDMNETAAWLIDRLIDSTHPAGWTEQRVTALMVACGAIGGRGKPDSERLASVFRRYPAAAIAAVRLYRVGGRPYAPRHQLLALARLDQTLLAGKEHVDLRAAIKRAVDEQAEIHARRATADREKRRLPELLDARGLDLDARDINLGMSPPRDLEPRHRDLLLQLIDRWWPASGFSEDLDETSRAALAVGSAIEAPLATQRWIELLDAHLSPSLRHYPLGDDSVKWWLRQSYTPKRNEAALIERIRVADGDAVRDLTIIGNGGADGPVTNAVAARLREIGEHASSWGSIVSYLAEHGGAEVARELLSDDTPPDARSRVIHTLARSQDRAAQLELLEHLISRVERGEQPDRLAFIDLVASKDVLAALGRLADATIRHDAGDVHSSVLGQLGQWPTPDVLDVLRDLVLRHGAGYPRIAILRDSVARHFATNAALERLPDQLADAAAWFEAIAEAPPSP